MRRWMRLGGEQNPALFFGIITYRDPDPTFGSTVFQSSV
jgi:hypothetical protein